MSVYTPVERDELAVFLCRYDIGAALQLSGIKDGIENTNYFLTTTHGHYVLTLFEWLTAAELPYFLDLMAHLAEHGIASAHPVAERSGHYLTGLKDKPAAIVQRLNGKSVTEPNLAQCTAIGRALGELHLAGLEFAGQRINNRGPRWWQTTRTKLDGHLHADDAALLDAELAFQAAHRSLDLPRGVIHADLFRDNALFVGDRLTGIIDFYYACNDVLLYDLAVTINDWCAVGDGGIDTDRSTALLNAYQAIRSLTSAERSAFPVLLRAAALRFYLSRLHDLHFPRPGELTHTKDPNVFRRILCRHIEHPVPA